MTALTAIMRAAEEGDYDLVRRRVARLSPEDRITLSAAMLAICTAIHTDSRHQAATGQETR